MDPKLPHGDESPAKGSPADSAPRRNLSARLEALGNRLPDPITLFAAGALAVVLLSHWAAQAGWSVEKRIVRTHQVPIADSQGNPLLDPSSGEILLRPAIDPASGAPRRERVVVRVEAVDLLSASGLYWMLSSCVDNFKNFPPLAIVLVGMLGIGVAERSGFLPVLLRATLLRAPPALLAPAVFFAGVMSSLGLDAGYVVLPPVAAALFLAAGRPPLAGIATAFAGVSAGFGANLAITGIDPLLAGLTERGAQILDGGYRVATTCNWWFAAVSTVVLTGVGWAVTSTWVEPRLRRRPASDSDSRGDVPLPGAQSDPLSPQERRGLLWGLSVLAAVLAAAAAATWIPGAPLHGSAGKFPRWVEAIVPLLFLGLLLPGIAYGVAAGSVRSDRQVADMLGGTMAAMGPYIAIAFFAAQFIAYFDHSHLGEMFAIAAGSRLAELALPSTPLIIAFIAVAALANLLIGSMSAKYAFFAPVFVPLLMQLGIAPELTQAAYRVGDSVTNVITPLNPYFIIVLALLRRYDPEAGLGTLIATMLPYAVALGLAWTTLLACWMLLGIPLGPAGPLALPPAGS